MGWVVNPVALARMIAQSAHDVRDHAALDALFGDAFGSDIAGVLYGSDKAPGIVALLQAIGDSTAVPRALDDILAGPQAKALIGRLGKDCVVRLLPFVTRVRDATFTPPQASAVPDAVPVIGHYATIGSLEQAGVSWLDPEQGCTNDCYLIAAMIAIAWARPLAWRARLAAATQGSKTPGVLRVTLHGNSQADPDFAPFDVPPRVPLDPANNLIYAHSAQTDETWPALLERAFVMQVCQCTDREPTVDDYRDAGVAPASRDPQVAARMLIGGTPGLAISLSDPHDPLSKSVFDRCDGPLTRYPIMAWTWPQQHPAVDPSRWRASALLWDHAYAVLGTMEEGGARHVVLRNPHGSNEKPAAWPDGEWRDGAPRNGGASVPLNRDGVFALPAHCFDYWFHRAGWVESPADA
jgi:hypothetical protein